MNPWQSGKLLLCLEAWWRPASGRREEPGEGAAPGQLLIQFAAGGGRISAGAFFPSPAQPLSYPPDTHTGQMRGEWAHNFMSQTANPDTKAHPCPPLPTATHGHGGWAPSEGQAGSGPPRGGSIALPGEGGVLFLVRKLQEVVTSPKTQPGAPGSPEGPSGSLGWKVFGGGWEQAVGPTWPVPRPLLCLTPAC